MPPDCVVAMETCSGAHRWARRLRAMGLEPRLIAGHFVGPYRMEGRRGKNDANDAACAGALRSAQLTSPFAYAASERSLLAASMQVPQLTVLRQQIDEIDEELVELLSRRFKVTDRVGQLKAEHGLHAVDPAREAQQAERLHELAMRHGVNADLVHRVFRSVVEQVVLNHRAIAVAPRSPSP